MDAPVFPASQALLLITTETQYSEPKPGCWFQSLQDATWAPQRSKSVDTGVLVLFRGVAGAVSKKRPAANLPTYCSGAKPVLHSKLSNTRLLHKPSPR